METTNWGTEEGDCGLVYMDSNLLRHNYIAVHDNWKSIITISISTLLIVNFTIFFSCDNYYTYANAGTIILLGYFYEYKKRVCEKCKQVMKKVIYGQNEKMMYCCDKCQTKINIHISFSRAGSTP